MNYVITIIAILTFSLAISANNGLYIPDLGSSARMIALGNIEGFSDSSYSVFENPAYLARIPKGSVSAFTTQLMDEANYRNGAVFFPTDYGTFGAGFMMVSVDNIARTAISSGRIVAEDYFNFSNSVSKLTYSHSITDHLSVGLGLTYLNNDLGTVTGDGFNGDVGLFYEWELLEISAQMKNVAVGSKINYSNGATEEFPLQNVLGLRLRLGDLKVLSQAKFISHQPRPLLSAGLHYNPSFISIFHIYGGYKEFHALQKVENTYTVGLGLSLFDVQFDYAFEKSDGIIFDNHNYFSVSVRF
jgi:hypothetical protein